VLVSAAIIGQLQFGQSARKTNLAAKLPQASVSAGRNQLQSGAHRLGDSLAAGFLRFLGKTRHPRRSQQRHCQQIIWQVAGKKKLSKRAARKVAQKSGMNRSILDASRFELRRQLEYKTQWQGGLLAPVPPQNTSRKCPECGHVSA
jgi:transposase